MTWFTIFTAMLSAGLVGESLLRIERWWKTRAERRREAEEDAERQEMRRELIVALRRENRKDAN